MSHLVQIKTQVRDPVAVATACERLKLRTIDAMAPCIAFADDLEKALAGVNGTGDSGVSTGRLAIAEQGASFAAV